MLKYGKFILFLFLVPILYFDSGASDISLASYTGNSALVSGQISQLRGATFSSDGSKMLVAQFSGTIYQYILTTPWNLASASYSGKTLPVSSQGNGAAAIHLTDNGLRLFVLQFYNRAIYQYDLTSPYEISSGSYSGKVLSLTGTNTSDPSFNNPYGMAVSPDASNIFVFSDYTDKVVNFSLTTPGELSTYRYMNQYAYGNLNNGQELGIGVTPNGLNMYIVTDTNDRIVWYSLPNAWSLVGASYSAKYLTFNSTDNQSYNLSFKRDSSMMYLAGGQNRRVYEISFTDNVAPTITSITSSTSNGSYREGDSINLTVNFSETVNSSGPVTLVLETGSLDGECTFTVTSSSTGTCTYVVGENDNTSDLNVNSISGTITDVNGNAMVNFVPTTNLATNKNIILDTNSPTFNSISFDTFSTSVRMVWTTSEIASSRVYYGIINASDFSTAETNVSTRVSSHDVTATGLLPCTTYKISAASRDTALNELTSLSTTTTSGCPVSSIETSASASISLSGGTLTLPNSGSIAKLIVPSSYYTTRASFQISKLETTSFDSLANSQTLAGNNLFKLVNLTERNSTIPTFTNNVTFEITYSNDVASSFAEDSLKVYKYNNGTWDDKNCSVDPSLNKITCLLSSFSVYGLFGTLDTSPQESVNNVSSKVIFSEDRRCHFFEPPKITWVEFKKGEEDGVNGMYVYWSQINADKINIKIDDGSGNYPWEVKDVRNTGKFFLKNVASWQKIKIQAINNCYPGDYSTEFSKDMYPNGWYQDRN